MTAIHVWGDSVLKGVAYNVALQKYQIIKQNSIECLSKTYNLIFNNYSKFGMTTTKAERLYDRWLNQADDLSGYLVLEFGGNDCDYNWSEVSENPDVEHIPFTPLISFQKKMCKMVEAAREKGLIPVLMNLVPIDSQRYFDWICRNGLNKENILHFLDDDVNTIFRHHASYSEKVAEVADAEQCDLIDVRTSFLEKPAYCDYLSIDGIHPNEAGHKVMFECFSSFLSKKAKNFALCRKKY